jgi:hypothetical protein
VNSIRSAGTGSPREIWPQPCQWELRCGYLTGRAFEWLAKPVGAGVNPRAAGGSPIGAPRVGDGRAGRPPAIIREPRRGQAAFMAKAPEEPPGGSQSVRRADEAGNDRGAKGRRKVEA